MTHGMTWLSVRMLKNEKFHIICPPFRFGTFVLSKFSWFFVFFVFFQTFHFGINFGGCSLSVLDQYQESY